MATEHLIYFAKTKRDVVFPRENSLVSMIVYGMKGADPEKTAIEMELVKDYYPYTEIQVDERLCFLMNQSMLLPPIWLANELCGKSRNHTILIGIHYRSETNATDEMYVEQVMKRWAKNVETCYLVTEANNPASRLSAQLQYDYGVILQTVESLKNVWIKDGETALIVDFSTHFQYAGQFVSNKTMYVDLRSCREKRRAYGLGHRKCEYISPQLYLQFLTL